MAIYNGNQKVSLSGIGAIYVGNQKVYQKITKVLTGITLSGYNSRLAQNAAFSYGGIVTANYSDGSTENVTSSATYSGYDMATAGVYSVIVSYTEDGLNFSSGYSLTVYGSNTVFSGSTTYSWNTGNTYTPPSGKDVYVNSNMPAGKYKITFSSSPSATYPSPVTATINPSSSITINSVKRTDSWTGTFWAHMQYNSTRKSFYLFGQYSKGIVEGTGSGTVSITVTKIEYVVE